MTIRVFLSFSMTRMTDPGFPNWLFSLASQAYLKPQFVFLTIERYQEPSYVVLQVLAVLYLLKGI